MKLEHIHASDAPTPGGSYSHGVVVNGFLFTCGMGPVNPTTGKIVEGGVRVPSLFKKEVIPLTFPRPIIGFIRQVDR